MPDLLVLKNDFKVHRGPNLLPLIFDAKLPNLSLLTSDKLDRSTQHQQG